MPLIKPEKVLGSDFTWNKIFYVLDDAQVFGEQYMGFFSDADGNPRPVLQPLLRVFTANHYIPIILSGTAFSMDHFPPGVSKAVTWKRKHGTGDFMVEDVQLAYIASLLPPAFLASISGKELLSLMYIWLRGR
jgi:hypothetical protein